MPSWDFEPGVRLSAFYDDNVRFSALNPESSSGGIAQAYSLLSRRSEFSDLSFRATVDGRYYVDVSELDTTDGSIEARYAYRADRTELGLLASFVYDTTLTSEEETTGLVQFSSRRKRLEVSPTWEYALSERISVGADVTFVDVSYEDVSEIVLSDYQFVGFGLNGRYDLSERTGLLGRLIYDQFESDVASGTSDTLGAEVGIAYDLSERTTLTALGGVRSATTDSGAAGIEDDTNTGPIFEVGLRRDYESGSIRLQLARSLIPSGRGELLDTTRAVLDLSYPISERWESRLRLSAVRNRNPGGETNFNDRDFLSISPELRWRLGESTWLDLSYRFRWQDRETLDGDAESNAVFLGFAHDWKAR